MVEAMGIGFLNFLPPVFFGLALAAWTAAFAGLVLAMRLRSMVTRPSDSDSKTTKPGWANDASFGSNHCNACRGSILCRIQHGGIISVWRSSQAS